MMLQSMGRNMGVLVDRILKCHPELEPRLSGGFTCPRAPSAQCFYMLFLFVDVGAVEPPTTSNFALPTGCCFLPLPTHVQLLAAAHSCWVLLSFFKKYTMATTNNDIINNAAPTATTTTAPSASITAAAAKKQKASEDKARRDEHLLRLIDGTTWQNADNFTVEENILKQMIGFDPLFFSVDMLHKICGKLGFVSRKYTKNVCLETLLKAYKDLQSNDVL